MLLTRVKLARSFPRRRTVWLDFTRDDPPSGEYYVIGGICFPLPVRREQGPITEGHIVVVGQNISSGNVIALADAAYHRLRPLLTDGKVVDAGVAPILADCFALYRCRNFFWNQPWDQYQQFMDAIQNDPDLPVKPVLEYVDWPNDDLVDTIVFNMIDHLFRYDRRSTIAEVLTSYRISWGAMGSNVSPCLHALRCVLYALEKWPWNLRDEPYA